MGAVKMKHVMSVVLAIGVVTSAASAATTQFGNLAAFQAASPVLKLENFNSVMSDVSLSGGAVFDAGDFDVTGPAVGVADIDFAGNGFVPPVAAVDGTSFIQGIGPSGHTLSLTFDSAITAFGIDLFGVNDGSIERTQIVVNGATFSLPVATGDVPMFFGLTSTVPFSDVTFKVLNAVAGEGGEIAGLDNVRYSMVPVPAAAWMALPLLVGLGITQSLKRKRLTA